MTRSGWGIIDYFHGQFKLVDFGTIPTNTKLQFPARLDKIYTDLRIVSQKFQPEFFAVEDVIYAANVKIALKLGHARGAILLAAAHCKIPVASYSPKEIKQSVTGNGNASKEQVLRMVQVILGKPQLETFHDVTDALAAAICHANRLKFARDSL
ncbi:MAG: crossover junction endodeoxyribonuclease RuvC [Deferribacteres bacterium]|nr:crossover junction endodeoxyribonuclease RuvC [candidate division KSB1 bacterium]MCB9502614.1 crossover junction endodeoxyribonuclease RuvC [Deferribacteres bacterium]